MTLFEHNCASPQEDIALDEALLDAAEAGEIDSNILRLWEPSRPLVVLGRASRFEQEVNSAFCNRHHIPILRRCSGGATILAGPGCLMYAVVLKFESSKRHPALDLIHSTVLSRIAAAANSVSNEIQIQGTSDLTIGDRKFSGNSLRSKRAHVLYHGTLLCQADLNLICHSLGTPPRQPDYRHRRDHAEFLTNLNVSTSSLRTALIDEWKAEHRLVEWPTERMSELVRKRYSLDSWNRKL